MDYFTPYVYVFLLSGILSYSQKNLPSDSLAIDSIFTDLKENLQKAEKTDHKAGIIQAQIQLGDLYNNLGIANEAIVHYYEALDLHEKSDTVEVYLKNRVGEVYLSLEKYNSAQKYLEEAYEVAEQLQFKKGEAIAYTLLGTVFEKSNDYSQAMEYQQRALTIFKTIEDNAGQAQAYENIGSVYEDLEEFERAYDYFQKALSIVGEHPSNLRINIINNLGDVNRKMGNYSQALTYLQQALDMGRATQNGHQEESALKDLAKLYANLDNYRAAYRYLAQYTLKSKEEAQLKNTEQVNTLQILYDIEEHEAKVNLLNKQNEINRVRQKNMLLISALVIMGLTGWLFYNNKKKQQQAKMQRYKQQLLQADLDRKTAEEASLQRTIRFKVAALTKYSLHLAHKNKLLSDVSRTLTHLKNRNTHIIKPKLEALTEEIKSNLAREQDWEEFIVFFEQIHPDFFQKLKKTACIALSPAEVRLCMLLRLNLSSKDIASILRISPDSVRVARYRLRKKLPIATKDDLQVFITEL